MYLIILQTRYADIKSLLQSKCGIQHVILDNLVTEGTGKKVTVGVAEDADAAILVRKINGLYWNEQQLYVEDVRSQKVSITYLLGNFCSDNKDFLKIHPLNYYY